MEKKLFYRTFFSMYIVLMLQNVITLSVNLADNIMLGGYSEIALSGVASVNQIQFVFQQFLLAVGDTIVVVGSQYWGKKDTGSMKKIAAIGMRTGIAAAVILFVLVTLFPSRAVGLFTTDQAIISEGVSYISIIRFTYLFFAITQVLLATLRSVETVKIAFYLSVSTLVINCGINYVLIYGRFGAPELGARGAAIGTLAARIVETAVVIIYIWKKEKNLNIRLRDYRIVDPLLRQDYFRVGIPTMFIKGLWGLNTALQTVILGHMTASAIAANSAASTLFLVMKSTAVGAAASGGVMIGKAIGQGDMNEVNLTAKRLQKMFIVIGLVSGTLLFFLRIPILSLYDLEPDTMRLANAFLIILSIVCMGMSYQMPTNDGIIRGGGNAPFVLKMDLISIWCIVIPLSLIMAFVVKASPIVVVCCLNADQVFKCIPAALEANFGNWARKLTR